MYTIFVYFLLIQDGDFVTYTLQMRNCYLKYYLLATYFRLHVVVYKRVTYCKTVISKLENSAPRQLRLTAAHDSLAADQGSVAADQSSVAAVIQVCSNSVA